MSKAMKVWVVLLGLGLVFVWTAPARGDAVSEKRKAQNKLLAARAARVDAIRKLAERIRGLTITSETTVRDFVAENDTIETALMAWLNGMKQVGRPRWMEDGTCEVTLEVKMLQIVTTLKSFHKRYYKGNKIKHVDFDQMIVTNKVKVLRETGMGVPRPDLEEPAFVVIGEPALESLTYLHGSAKAYWLGNVTGRGRLMSVRAARVEALRRLGERISGVFINSTTTVRDFVAESDQIDVTMITFIRGAKEKSIFYHDAELIVEVEMAVKLRELLITLKSWGTKHYKGDRVRITEFDQLIIQARDKVITETGMGVPPEKYLKQATAEIRQTLAIATNAPGWISRTIRVTGNSAVDNSNGNPAQAKLMAYRAAELDGRRKLAEQISGLMITSNTSVRDFVAENDEIETSMLTFQQGGRVIPGSQKLMEDGTAQVTVEIDLAPLWRMVIYWQRKLSIRIA